MTPERAPAAARPVPGPRLPRGVRAAALALFLLSSFTMMSSLQDLMVLSQPDALREALARPGAAQRRGAFDVDPALQRRALETQLSALEPMRGSRSLLLVGLAGACFLCIGAAGHLLRRAGPLPREGMRQLLGRAAIVAAVLRTIEGAQTAVVWRRLGPELIQGTPGAEQLQYVEPSYFAAAAMLYTALVAGTFLLLGQYFRSERVRALVAAQEPPLRRDA